MRSLVVTALTATTFAASLAGSLAAPAVAADTVSVPVAYADLDLASEAGQKALATRISTAVKAVCARPDTRNLKAAQAWEQCKASAFSSAQAQYEESIQLAGL